ncbi:MAG: PAS domain-containing protein [Desulfobulbaceae bacterium]
MKFFHYRAVVLALALSGIAWVLYAAFDYIYLHQQQVPFSSLLAGSLPAHEHVVGNAHKVAVWITAALLLVSFAVIISYYLNKLEASEIWLKNILNNVIPICVTDNQHRIILANDSYEQIFGPVRTLSGPIMCHDSRPGPKCKTEECPLFQITQRGKASYTCESKKTVQDVLHHYIVTATPLLNHKGRQNGIIESFQDITPRKLLEQEKENLITELREALAKVKLLSGLIPICAACKKIRDDKGYWTQIETYIRNHSEAEFSHGICPECAERLYGEDLKDD